MNIPEELHEAGKKFDGHVTNGSLNEQLKIVRQAIREFVKEVSAQLKTAGDFGKFEEEVSEDFRAYPEYVAIQVLKKVEKEFYGN